MMTDVPFNYQNKWRKRNEGQTDRQTDNYNNEQLFNIIKEIYPNSNQVMFSFLGGMTNQNYLLNIDKQKYVLRLPGAMTSHLISRTNEMNNSILIPNTASMLKPFILMSKMALKSPNS